MKENKNILTDSFGRQHTYLRISLTELCNLRCSYCMPAEGIQLLPKSHIMNYEEVFTIAKTFVDHGVNKIRLTGGEPLVRRDADQIIEKLASLNIELSITTNAVIVDRFIDCFKKNGVNKINVSLDSLVPAKFKSITRRDQFNKVFKNLELLIKEGFKVKLNAVLIKGFNDDEIIDFIELSKLWPISVRFIEFMPFDGNKWDRKNMVSLKEILDTVDRHYGQDQIIRLKDAPNDTSKNYKIKKYEGSFAIISSVTNPFCDSCNRIRLTANGRIKNCLFSNSELDLLNPLRNGDSIEPLIEKAMLSKFKVRGGMDTIEKLERTDLHSQNRSMIRIGG
ncbi:MAG: GTP 3',8-cyclase MoaA [Flavobacteriaceae bacterium]|nr:GTP 3',8-cyclase MoaA [Flavobacteriaceae bacterium]